MVSVRGILFVLLIAIVGSAYSNDPLAVESQTSSVVGDLMTTLFSPTIAAETKTMAILQRTSLLDQVTRSRSLEIALLIDGTESMTDELAGVRQRLDSMIDDLQRILPDRVTVQIVIYRDVAAPSGVVEFAMPASGKSFTSDRKQIAGGLERLVAESGAPYFFEPVDVGLYRTITELPWSTNEDAARWILMVGDAPPFDDGFSEPENHAERKYSDQQLLQLAQQKGITVHSVLCRSRDSDQEAYTKVLHRTQGFFSSISEGTGGTTIDLSNAVDQQNIREAAKRAAVKYKMIEPISEADVENVLALAAKSADPSKAIPSRPVRIAVLPFMPQQKSTIEKGNDPFDGAKNPTIYLVNRIVSTLDSIGAEAIHEREIVVAFREARKELKQNDSLAIRIGELVNSDYVLCSSQSSIDNGRIQYDYAMLSTDKGEYVVKQRSKSGDASKGVSAASAFIVSDIAEATLASPLGKVASANDLRKLMSKAAPPSPKLRQVSQSESKEIEEAIIRAHIALEGVVDLELLQSGDADDKTIRESLAAAEKELEIALANEPDNPTANLVRANIRMSEILLNPNGKDVIRKHEQATQYLEKAKRGASRLSPTESAELEADLAVLNGEDEKAIASYLEMEKLQGSLAASLRARWMLMGLYSGDWGVSERSPSLVNASDARAAAIRILAFHPTSKHANRLRKTLRISAQTPESASPALPLKNPKGF